MSQPLLLLPDPLLGQLYGSLLSQNAAAPLLASAPSEVQQFFTAGSVSPTALLIDPVLCFGSGRAALEPILAVCASKNVPVCALPTPLEPLARSAQKMGIASFACQKPSLPALVDSLAPLFPAFSPNDLSQESVTELRRGLPELLQRLQTALRATSTPSPSALPRQDLLQVAHVFAIITGFADPALPYQLSRAILQTVFELFQPAAASLSLYRTLAQGLDLFSILLEQDPPLPPGCLSQILVVEDDPNTSQLICAALEFVELESTPALNAEDALRLAESHAFGLLLLDIGLPAMSGLEFCRRLRTLASHQKTPVVFLTGLTDLPHRLQSNLNGGNDFVCKPFNVHELGLKALIWALRHRLHTA